MERGSVFLDHAASTPPLPRVMDAVREAAGYYANVHRGAGLRSRATTWAFERAREIVAGFAGARTDQVVVFTRNTTAALNQVAGLVRRRCSGGVVLTGMEHHSNDLPWRQGGPLWRAGVLPDGTLDIDHLAELLARHRGDVDVVSVTAASNVTGYVNDLATISRLARDAGALLCVDAAQLVAHRPVQFAADFIAFSGHKMYAPFGCGALVLPRTLADQVEPWESGGGTVDAVGTDDVIWTVAPDRHEAGTPPVLGAIAMAAAAIEFQELGWDFVERRERPLTNRLLDGLATIPEVELLGNGEPDRVGVVSFNVRGHHHSLVAAALDHEWGIGVRSGCFCAHPYVKELLGLDREQELELHRRIARGERDFLPGAVRMSLGLSTTPAEIDLAVEAVAAIAAHGPRNEYVEDREHGIWRTMEPEPDFESLFPGLRRMVRA